MKFAIVKTIVVTTRELYEVEIGEHEDPLDYISSCTPVSTTTEREVKADIFKKKKR